MSILDSNKVAKLIPNQRILGNEVTTYSVTSRGVKETLSIDNSCRCLVVTVSSITSCAALAIQDNDGNNLIYHNRRGEIGVEITSTGTYFYEIDITMQTIKLYCTALAASGTADVCCGWIDHIPEGIASLKPIQLIKSVTASVSSTDQFTLLQYSDAQMKAMFGMFKYFFFSYQLTNGGTASGRDCRISIQPYHNYGGTYKPGKTETISTNSAYSYQSDWMEVRGESARVYVKYESYTEGDTITLNIYGVR